MALRGFHRLRIAVFAMLLGGLWRLNEYYMWMGMRELSVSAASPAVEERYWEMLPSQCLRFWPLFMQKSKDIAAFLEKTTPVLVETRMTGFGSFAADIKLLSPSMVVEWRGEVWCVSKEGRMWNMAEECIGDLNVPVKPLWRVADSQVASGDVLPAPGGVFPSIFSTEVIDDFLEGIAGASWFGGVEEVVLGRRAGSDLFTLRYVQGGQVLTIIIQKDKWVWHELSLALEKLLALSELRAGSYLLDATYEDEKTKEPMIVVRNLSAGAVEGSSR